VRGLEERQEVRDRERTPCVEPFTAPAVEDDVEEGRRR
jgi:hypothetical protein